MQKIDWGDLAYFVTLVQAQTLTACADKMGVQHSTVARRIERLEQALGIQLFDRLGKRYVLTDEGDLLYSQAVKVQEGVTVFTRMATDHNAMQGEVTVSAPPVLANEVIMPALADFRRRYPDIIVRLQGDVHLSNLHQKEADIAIRLTRPTQDDLLIRTLGQIDYGFYAHRDYIQQTPCAKRQFIEFTANARLNKWFTQILAEIQTQIPQQTQQQTQNSPLDSRSSLIAFASNDLYMVERAVNQAVGIGILPSFLTAQNSALLPMCPFTREPVLEPILKPVTFNPTKQQSHSHQIATTSTASTQSSSIYLVMHPDVAKAPRVRAVADWLVAGFVK